MRNISVKYLFDKRAEYDLIAWKVRTSNLYNQTMDIITDEILMNGILPLIGEFHFRYIAGINRQYYRVYTYLYPRKETYFLNGNIATLQV